MKKVDVSLSFILIAFGAFVIVLCNDPDMPEVSSAFPFGLAVLLILLSLLLLALSIVGKEKQAGDKKEEKNEGEKILRLPVFLCLVLVLVYCFIIEVIGYIASTILLVSGTTFVLGNRNPVATFSVAFGITFFIYIIFSKFFSIPLPAGSIWGG